MELNKDLIEIKNQIGEAPFSEISYKTIATDNINKEIYVERKYLNTLSSGKVINTITYNILNKTENYIYEVMLKDISFCYTNHIESKVSCNVSYKVIDETKEIFIDEIKGKENIIITIELTYKPCNKQKY